MLCKIIFSDSLLFFANLQIFMRSSLKAAFLCPYEK